jgi:hypothetical protein
VEAAAWSLENGVTFSTAPPAVTTAASAPAAAPGEPIVTCASFTRECPLLRPEHDLWMNIKLSHSSPLGEAERILAGARNGT